MGGLLYFFAPARTRTPPPRLLTRVCLARYRAGARVPLPFSRAVAAAEARAKRLKRVWHSVYRFLTFSRHEKQLKLFSLFPHFPPFPPPPSFRAAIARAVAVRRCFRSFLVLGGENRRSRLGGGREG